MSDASSSFKCKKQDIFKDVNPLFKIYGTNNETAHYIPPKKRRQISEYMGKTSLTL